MINVTIMADRNQIRSVTMSYFNAGSSSVCNFCCIVRVKISLEKDLKQGVDEDF